MPRIRLPRAFEVDLEGALEGLLEQVPRGRVTTYGALAGALGDRQAAVWIARRLLGHEHDGRCRCHRVIRVGGRLPPGRAELVGEHARRLAGEGIRIDGDSIDLGQFGVASFRSQRPLAALARLQSSLRRRVSLAPPPGRPRTIGGVDVSYRGDHAVAAYTLFRIGKPGPDWSTTVCRRVTFPYIPGYLSFRELPVLVALLNEVAAERRMADVLLVDGTGILHPRRIGIASHLGLVAGRPTIGVAKKLLAGRMMVGGTAVCRKVGDDDGQLGWAMLARAGDRRPLYVSPGHGVDLEMARRLVAGTLTGKRLPEPLSWADQISRRRARDMARTC